MSHEIKYSPAAVSDLDEVFDYLLEEANFDAACNITNNILDTIDLLKLTPEIGVKLNNRLPIPTDYRMLVIESYLAFYRIENDGCVLIIRIINEKRDYIKVLSK